MVPKQDVCLSNFLQICNQFKQNEHRYVRTLLASREKIYSQTTEPQNANEIAVATVDLLEMNDINNLKRIWFGKLAS